MSLGLALMHGISDTSKWTTLLAGFIEAGVGVGLVNPPLASTAIGVVEQRRSGMASGVNTTFRQVGLATGIAALGALFLICGTALAKGPAPLGDVAVASLPKEARETLAQIKSGAKFAHPKDGSTFGNREKILPAQKRGYYREYTVKTPGSRTRGARRIIKGGGGELFYTDDHYNSFKRIRE